MERKGCESIRIRCYTHFVAFNFDLNHDLDLGFSRSTLKILYFKNGMADWHGMKGMWVDRILDPLCDFQRSPHHWPWPRNLKVKFLKSRMSGMRWLVDMARKGCESIECWPHVVTFNVHLNHDLGLGFSRSNFQIAIYIGMLGLMDIERKRYELVGVKTYHVAFSYDLDLGFSRWNFEMLYLRNGKAHWLGTKGTRVDRMLDSHCGFKLWPRSWPWP